jgi:uncharacterized SAM-binding protein YcdF (DUF218 family)
MKFRETLFIASQRVFACPGRKAVEISSVCLFLLVGLLKVGSSLLLGPLETRFPLWRQKYRKKVDGIVLLGGFHLDKNVGDVCADISYVVPERVVATVRLSELYPQARVLYSGGGTEAVLGKKALVRLGVLSERIIIEDKSRNTYENAKFSKMIAAPKESETWVLVTSAYHMPRAMGVFRAVGFPVEAYPVGFLGPRAGKHGRNYGVLALREYIALMVYWLCGRSDELFPSP